MPQARFDPLRQGTTRTIAKKMLARAAVSTIQLVARLSAAQTLGIREISRPVMLKLAEATKETVSTHAVSGRNLVCIDAMATVASPLRNVVQAGEQVPLRAGSASKVLMAYMQESALTPIVSTIARQTKRSQADVLDELAQVRRQGDAASHGERLLGVTAISAPTVDAHDEVRYCLSHRRTDRQNANERKGLHQAREERGDGHLTTFGGKQD